MNDKSRTLDQTLPDALVVQIDELCAQFQHAWTSGRHPRIEEYLLRLSVDQQALFQELIALEVKLRTAAGQEPKVVEYVTRFPNYEKHIIEAIQTELVVETSSLSETIDLPASAQQSKRNQSEDDRAPQIPIPSRYELLSQVGSGGMGTVFLARHKSLEAKVAIKLVHFGGSNERFLNEAQVLAKIRSPFVVRVNDYEILDGTPILIMEWIDGTNLWETINEMEDLLDHGDVLRWMRQVCEGMCAAEDQGIIHRDLKPSNIIIDKAGDAHVADFGLAHNPQTTAQLSASSGIMGTAHYIAPEQAENPRSVDTRADIYSFGATFYHVLTGVPPFNGDSWFSILLKHKTEPLIPPKSRNSRIMVWMSELLERCLAKSQDDRFHSFRDLGRILARRQLNDDEDSPWDEINDDELTRHIERFRSRRAEYLAPPKDDNLSDRYEFSNGRALHILRGDIIEQKVDAIVNSVGSHLDTNEGVSAAICTAAGPSIKEFARFLVPAQAGRAVVTPAGQLDAKYIFHAVTIGQRDGEPTLPSRDVISEALKSCLYHADTHLVHRIAFPLLGTGERRFARSVCLDTMFRQLSRTLAHGLTTIRQAIIVLPSAKALTDTDSASNKKLAALTAEVRAENLARIAEILEQDESFADSMPAVLRTLLTIFEGAGRATIFISEAGKLAPKWTVVRDKRIGDILPINDAFARQVMKTRQAARRNAKSDVLEQRASIGDSTAWPAICAPFLNMDSNLIGIIQVDSPVSHTDFRQQDVGTLSVVAHQVQAAIGRAAEGRLQELRIRPDLETASENQHSLLPNTRPTLETFEFFDFYRPADWVGGDFFDYIPLSDECLVVAIGDVSGHGRGAALLSAEVIRKLRLFLTTQSDPSSALAGLNNSLFAADGDRFVTMNLVVLNSQSQEIEIINAGHMWPLLRRSSDTLEVLGVEQMGVPLGVIEGGQPGLATISLNPGDSIVMFTDGITEAMNANGEQYGTNRIHDKVRLPCSDLFSMCQRAIDDVLGFIGDHKADDMCLVGIRRC